jgi:transposase-like protein
VTISFARRQFPPAIVRHAVWLYARFTLSYRDVEELLAERGLDVSYETVRRWVLKFGPICAQELRRRHPRPTSRWRLDGRDDCGARQGRSGESDAQAAQETRLRARGSW